MQAVNAIISHCKPKLFSLSRQDDNGKDKDWIETMYGLPYHPIKLSTSKFAHGGSSAGDSIKCLS